MPRDDFSASTIWTLAARAGARCSNPGCRKPTSGPQEDPAKAVNIGVAAQCSLEDSNKAARNPDCSKW